MTNAEKLATRPISELDVSAWPRCSTSYVQLPKDYPAFKCSGRTPEQASILNDIWVSVTSGSEDYSFKVRNADLDPVKNASQNSLDTDTTQHHLGLKRPSAQCCNSAAEPQ